MTDVKAILTSINKQKPLEQLIVDGSEVSVDQLLKSGILKEIPIVKTLVSISRVGLGIREYFYLKKIYRFLESISSVTESEKEAFLVKYGKTDLGSDVMLILEKSENLVKADYIGRAFQALLKGNLDEAQFQNLSAAINRCNAPYLSSIQKVYHSAITEINAPLYDNLFQAGFLSFAHASGAFGGGGSGYYHNDLGRLFIKYCLKSDPP